MSKGAGGNKLRQSPRSKSFPWSGYLTDPKGNRVQVLDVDTPEMLESIQRAIDAEKEGLPARLGTIRVAKSQDELSGRNYAAQYTIGTGNIVIQPWYEWSKDRMPGSKFDMKHGMARNVSHELGHAWYYSRVTPAWDRSLNPDLIKPGYSYNELVAESRAFWEPKLHFMPGSVGLKGVRDSYARRRDEWSARHPDLVSGPFKHTPYRYTNESEYWAENYMAWRFPQAGRRGSPVALLPGTEYGAPPEMVDLFKKAVSFR